MGHIEDFTLFVSPIHVLPFGQLQFCLLVVCVLTAFTSLEVIHLTLTCVMVYTRSISIGHPEYCGKGASF